MNDTQIQNVYPLTPMQKGMLFHTLADPDTPVYFQQTLLTIGEKLDIDRLEASLNTLVRRHDMLRTVFLYKEVDEPLQVVLTERELRINEVNIQHLLEDEQEQFVADYAKRDLQQPFALDADALLRIAVFPCANQKCKLLLSFSHLIMDGWCVGTIAKELFQLYRGLPLDTPARPFSSYAEWLLQQDESIAIDYWRTYLDGIEEVTTLPGMKTHSETMSSVPAKWTVTLNTELTLMLSQLAARHQVTLSTLYQTVWGILLQHYNCADDVVFGTVVSGRPAEVPGIEQMVGLFINTVPVRVKATGEQLLSEVMKNVQDGIGAAESYHYVSLADIQQQTPLHNQLVQHLFVFENYPISEQVVGAKGEIGLMPITGVDGFEQTNYDFTIDIIPGTECCIQLTYNADKFDEQWISRISEHYVHLLQQAVELPQVTVNALSIVTEEEQHLLLNEFNTPLESRELEPIVCIFERQARQTPERTALMCGAETMTYDELRRNSNRLARWLLAQGIGEGSVVAICCERSFPLPVAMLAAWKAGAAYLPIDPEYPEERIAYMLSDCRAAMLLTDKPYSPDSVTTALRINTIHETLLALGAYDDSDLPLITDSKKLAYMIYTSGTTGKPKGIMIEQRNLADYVDTFIEYFRVSEHDRVLHHSSISFDTSVEEMFPALLVGGAVVMMGKYDLLEPKSLIEELQEKGVTIVSCSPLLLQELNRIPPSDYYARLYISGGDVLKKSYYNNLIGFSEIYNTYGPTETTVCATYYRCSGNEEVEHIPIGKPIPHKQVLIMNHRGQLQPIGVPGEICISGAGTGAGYMNLPKLTGEKFVDHPYDNDEKLYRSGDRGVWLPDGNIEFLGRMDHQVKIRGYRIETGEIERLLTEHDNVEDALVLAVQVSTGELALSAYYSAALPVSVSELRSYLARLLPDYMIPAYFVKLNQFPTNVNGKVDRKSLPNPLDSLTRERAFEPPIGKVERQIAELWEQVLEVAEIGRGESFFELGGHSLKATVLISRINQLFGSSLSIREVFRHPTIEQLARRVRAADKAGYQSITAAPYADSYPVSSAQKRLLVIHEFDKESTAYHMTAALSLIGNIDADRIEAALRGLIARHESLRTSFHYLDGIATQRVHAEVPFALERLELPEEGDTSEQSGFNKIMSSFVRPFDLTAAPLIRAALVRYTDRSQFLVLDMHHLISDGTSIEVLVSEFNSLYSGKQLPELTVHYKDYAVWQEQLANSGELEEHRNYWIQALSEPEELRLPEDYPRPPVKNMQGEGISELLDEQVADEVRRLAKETGTTAYNVLLAVYYVLLYKYSGQTDMIVGTPIAGRPLAELQSVVGMFVNMLPIRNRIAGNLTFREFLEQVQESFIAAHDHQACGLEDMLEHLGIERDLSRNPLFETVFVYQNTGNDLLELEGIRIRPIETASRVAKFDLTLHAEEEGALIHLRVDYSTALFKEESVKSLLERYIRLVKQVCRNAEARIAELDLMSPEQAEHVLNTFVYGQPVPIAEKVLHKLVEQQVERTPEHISVVLGERQWTYRQLNDYANHYASIFMKIGIVRGDRVGLLLHSSLEAVAALLGVLKAGAAYVPFDPEHPMERLVDVIDDSGIKLLVTNEQHNITDVVSVPYLRLEDVSQVVTANSVNPDLPVQGSDSAYVIYTSGTTGKAKGVVIAHEGISNTIQWRSSTYGLNTSDAALQLFHYTFDGFVASFFTPLVTGSKVVMLEQGQAKDPAAIRQALLRYDITHLIIIPPLYQALLEYLSPEDMLSIKSVTLAGDQTTSELVRISKEKSSHVELVNEYGPSENSIASTFHFGLQVDEEVTIGRPIWNTNVYVTNRDGQIQPVGIPGEIVLSGIGLSSGYVNRPELTADKFVSNPYEPGKIMYKTGDCGKWLPDGNIEYIGRVDHQLKIRGYRIEPGEIEAVLLADPVVKEAVVTVFTDASQQRRLCAYVVPEIGHAPQPEHIKVQLERKLPHYMIPSAIVILERMPLTSTGKLNRGALPKPIMTELGEAVMPGNEREALLLSVWRDVLGLDSIGLQDNFFSAGGDSIKAIQVAARVRQYGYALDMKQLFQHPTISTLSRFVVKDEELIEQGAVSGNVILTPIQRWFWSLPFAEKHHFNQSVMLYRKEHFDESVVQEVFHAIVEHHDALRMTFRQDEDGRIGAYNREVETPYFDWELVELGEFAIEQEAEAVIANKTENLQRSMNLEEGPLVKLCLFRGDAGDHLFIAVHHLVVDGVSWRILLEDFTLAYQQRIEGKPVVLPGKTISLMQWATAMLSEAEQGRWNEERTYWSSLQSGGVSKLPKMRTESAALAVELERESESVVMTLDAEHTASLLQQANQAYNTETNDILLTALYLAIREWCGMDKLLLQAEGHGREDVLGLNISRTVGWFTSTYPIALHSERPEDLSYTIRFIKDSLRRIPNKGIGYGILKEMTTPDEQQNEMTLYPEIGFNYLGQFDEEQRGGLFQFSSMPKGEEISRQMPSSFLLDLNGMIAEGQLTFHFDYDVESYSAEHVQMLADGYQRWLLTLIDHCVNKQTTESSPSDFVYDDMSIDEFEQLAQLLDQKISG
ncbi:non-ribosomal peptide synthetase [Paenibacillus fonticola]|uniref:non-ribosomal peptide synthetase n=1 Tax=Paenibacillus fonticola TaxID=379896 RepID=UPI00039A9F05|nr:non-ribosomal peptide synthetase [Paenibacillus fonticola]